MKNKNKSGAALLIYLLVMSILLTLLMAGTYSRLLVAINRGQSAIDTLDSSYRAESEVNDFLARLSGGYISDSMLPISFSKDVGGTSIDINATLEGETQRVVATVGRFLASTRVVAERKVESIEDINQVELVLSLDCTGSMNAGANCDNCNSLPSRFNAQEDAALNFIDKLSTLPDRQKFRLGVLAFGIDSKWLRVGGVEIKPENNVSLSQIRSAIEIGFGNTKATSPACEGIMDATSVGTAFAETQNYFTSSKRSGVKQVAVVITDGDPNSRIPFAGCSPSTFCPAFPIDTNGNNYCEDNQYGWQCHQYSQYQNSFDSDGFNQTAYNTCKPLGVEFLSCSVADSETEYEPGRFGIRDPEVDAYAVTIFSRPPADVVSIFNRYLGPERYFNASRASQLTQLLNTILNEIISDREVVNIQRELPGQQ
jgi:von Willebrand factor type A domain